MFVTITEFADLARTDNGHLMPLGGTVLARQETDAVGELDDFSGSTRFIRVATDTAIKLNGDLVMPGSEYLAVSGGGGCVLAAAAVEEE